MGKTPRKSDLEESRRRAACSSAARGAEGERGRSMCVLSPATTERGSQGRNAFRDFFLSAPWRLRFGHCKILLRPIKHRA